MQSHLWWRGGVIYQIYPRSFFDSDGDGIGDLPGIISKLEYVASLGVDAIWLCPFFSSPQHDFGYDVANYVAVDPVFGTLDDFDMLLTRAHDLGLRVILDQVWSHTSNEHAWFHQSRASQTNTKADWYVWADPRPDGMPPNNWLSVFGGSAWTWEPRRRQYYLHHFLSSQPNLNFDNPAVLEAILQSGRFWLDRGVDGFRLDAVDFIMHDAALRDNPAAKPPNGVIPAKLFALQDHVHDVLQPARYAVYRAIRDLMDEYEGTTTIAEVSSQPGAFQRVIDYTRGDRHMHMAYTLGHMRGEFDWSTVQTMLHDAAKAGQQGHVCWSFSNHDTMRAISRWRPRNCDAKQFAALLAHLLVCMPGAICVYQGEELGLSEADLTHDQLRDPFGIAYWPEFKGRDGSRTPIPWTDQPIEKSWLPIPAEHLPLAVSIQESDPASLLHIWRRAIALRRTHPVLRQGGMQLVALPSPCVGFIRTHAGSRMLCLFNLDAEPVTICNEFFAGIINGFSHLLITL